MAHALIIGAGRIGQALSRLLGTETGPVYLWDIDPARRMPDHPSLSELCQEAVLVFYCAPAAAIKQVAEQAVSALPAEATIISLAKGLNPETGQTTAEQWQQQLLPSQKLILLSGPMMAEELSGVFAGWAVAATNDQSAFDQLAHRFEHTNLHLEYSDDLIGTSLCGVLKNVYSVLIGVVEGVGAGENGRGYFVARAMAEMVTIGQALGGQAQTFYGTAGLADFVTTAYSTHSANHRAGLGMAETGKSYPSEGVLALQPLLSRLEAQGIAVPQLLQTTADIFLNNLNPQEAIHGLIR